MRFDPLLPLLSIVVLALVACTNPTVEAEKAKAARVPELPPSSDPLDQLLAQQAQKLALGMSVHDNAFRGDLAQGSQQDFLVVLTGGHCYRALGVAETGVNDFDLSLIDPNGSPIQQDVTRDALPVLGQDAPLCLSEPGAHRLHVRMRDGSGGFLVRFFKTEH